MALSWNEIKSRAIEFSKEWKDNAPNFRTVRLPIYTTR